MRSIPEFSRSITVNTHSSIRIAAEGKVIYVDPFELTEEPHDADLIFLTHDHFDHYSPKDIAKVRKPETAFVLPHSTAKLLTREFGVKKALAVLPNERGEAEGIRFETIPAYNPQKHFHPRQNNWVGYVMILEGVRVYVAGDTDATAEAEQVRCDVALLPIGGTYTMDAAEAAALAGRIRPQLVIPIHYGSVAGSPSDYDRFCALTDRQICVERRI